MKSIIKFLLVLFTSILILAYSIGISGKFRNPTFKNLSYTDYVWLGVLIVVLLFAIVKWIYSDLQSKKKLSRTSVKPIKQYDVFLLAKDLNIIMVKGMQGVVLETLGHNSYLVEFVKKDGSNYEFDGQATFIVDSSFIGDIVWTTSK